MKRKLENNEKVNKIQKIVIYYGENKCEGKYNSGKLKGSQCNNNAYYLYQNKIYCGQHFNSKTKGSDKKNHELPKRSKEEKGELNKEKLNKDLIEIENERSNNIKENKRSKIILQRLNMMKNAKDTPGFIQIYPNFKHSGKTKYVNDKLVIFGCHTLSPKYLGPIEHNLYLKTNKNFLILIRDFYQKH